GGLLAAPVAILGLETEGFSRSAANKGIYGILLGYPADGGGAVTQPGEAVLVSVILGGIGAAIGWLTKRPRRGAGVAAAAEATLLPFLFRDWASVGDLYMVAMFAAIHGAIGGAVGGLASSLNWSSVRAELGPLPADAPSDVAAARRL